jgi:hypothetical protein
MEVGIASRQERPKSREGHGVRVESGVQCSRLRGAAGLSRQGQKDSGAYPDIADTLAFRPVCT